MNLIVNKTQTLSGTVTIPGSKSLSIRALLFALLARGETTLTNILDADDTLAAKEVCLALGAEIDDKNDALIIKSKGLPLRPIRKEIHTYNSGITTLFSLPLLGLRDDYTTPIILNCGEQMRSRPIKSLVDALCHLGMTIEYLEQNDRPPLLVQGKLKGGFASIDGLNSQYLSALLISLPCADHDSVITVHDLHERPYVDMTLSFLQQLGIHYDHEKKDSIDTFIIKGQQQYHPFTKKISGDFSSASCIIAAAAILPGMVELYGLDFDDAQGDKNLINLLQSMGANIDIKNHCLRIQGNPRLNGMRIDADHIPDLLPALAVIGTQAQGKTEIVNVSQARIKEVDRIHSMTEGLKKMGAIIDEHHDGMTIHYSPLRGTFVKGYGDHRTVMALTIAGMIANGTTVITDGEAINKTYPQFVKNILSLGADIAYEDLAINKHIILIGFKNVGKSLVGQQLAKVLNKKYIDLDRELEKTYENQFQLYLSCREIMQKQGELFYRKLESQVLKDIIKLPPGIISLGGGTVLDENNQKIIQNHTILHVYASRGIVFERIMVTGIPTFFDPSKDHYVSFNELWNEREKIYKKLTPYTVNNSKSIDDAVSEAIQHLSQQEQLSYV